MLPICSDALDTSSKCRFSALSYKVTVFISYMCPKELHLGARHTVHTHNTNIEQGIIL